MRHILSYVLLIISVVLLSACSDIELEDNSSIVMPDGRLRLTLNYELSQGSVINTKAVDHDRENNVINAYLLLFEVTDDTTQTDSDRLLQVVKATITPGSIQPEINFIVAPYKDKCRVKVLANLDKVSEATVSSYKTLSESSNPVTIRDYKGLRVNAACLQGTEAEAFLPLYSAESQFLNGINDKTNLTATLRRIYSRIEVSLDPSITDFNLEEVYVTNAYKSGRFEPYASKEFPVFNHDSVFQVSIPAENNTSAGPLYLFENMESVNGESTTTVILKGVYTKNGNTTAGYYNLFIEYEEDKVNQYAINRNFRYKIHIIKVAHYGYSTLEEAKQVPAENTGSDIDMDIEVDDMNKANDIIYHNQGYAISSSNTDVDIYAASAESEYIAATLNFIKNPDHPNQFIPSRSINILNDTKDIILVNKDAVVNATVGTPVDLIIKATKPDVTATIEIRFGGLRKLITVRSFKMLRSDKQYQIEVPDVLNVEKDDNSTETWLKFNTTLEYDNASATNMTLGSPQIVYCIVPENQGLTREATPVYLFRKGKGTLKVIVTQTYGSSHINELYFRETGSLTDATHAAKRANSLMIPTKQAQTYRLTGSRIYDYYNNTIQFSNPKAEIVWTDFKFKDPNPFEPHDLIEIENPSGNIDKILLRVRNYHSNCGNNGNGNVIWGIKDDSGVLIWNWHVWLTDLVEESFLANNMNKSDIAYKDYPQLSILANKNDLKNLFEGSNIVSVNFLQTTLGSVNRVYLDRNLGARTTATLNNPQISKVDANKHYGLYYQWGRKDPFPINEQFFTPSNPTTNNRLIVSKERMSIKEAFNNPFNYIITEYGSTVHDWCSEPDLLRWNNVKGSVNKKSKTLLDPSPYGWRLNWGYDNDMTDKTWLSYSDNSSYGGMLVNNKFWFPATGYYSYSTGSITLSGGAGGYWTASDNETDNSNIWCSYFNKDANGSLYFIPNSHFYRSYGCQIRPVLDN